MINITDSPAIVTPMSYSGLGIVRSLGRKRIPVFAIDSDPNKLGMQSKYCTPLVSPDFNESEEDFVNFLVEFGKNNNKKSIFYPTGDGMVLLFSKYRERLMPYFYCLMPDDKLVRDLVSKDGLVNIADKYNIPSAETFIPDSMNDVELISKDLQFPVIIKPNLSPAWHDHEIYKIIGKNNKVVVVNSKQELRSYYARIAEINKDMIIQELIPGDDENLYYVCIYCNKNSEPIGVFGGQKIRVYPIHFGSASYVRSYYDSKLIDLSKRIVKDIGYKGLCGIEFKKDPRDNTYKIIEVNVRFGLWDMLGEKCGVNLAYMAYLDAFDQKIEQSNMYRTGVIWLALKRDFAAFRSYKREGILSTFRWLRSLVGPKSCAVYSIDDLKPFLETSYMFWSEKLRKKFSR